MTINKEFSLIACVVAAPALVPVLHAEPFMTGRARVEAWFAKYGTIPAKFPAALAAASDVRVDFDPISAFPEPVR